MINSLSFATMIHAAIIEDNISFLKAMQVLISNQPDMLLVYTSNNLLDIDALYHSSPDVVIMDIDLPYKSGIEGVKLLKEKLPNTGVFMLTVFEDEEKIFNSVKAGALGYLLKKDPPEKIIEAIHSVYNGESIINGKIARKMLEYFSFKEKNINDQLNEYKLTKREREILQLLIEGKSYKIIADTCNISMHTLFTHTKNIYNKLNIHSRAEIAAKFHS
ncbi:MAG: response regulator transcription factor [Ferruginibacter sp.]|nr:response regulator transcription factor [Bacteroidota bacterium]MBX2919219.1 response regulator transcription factor [Ferruginibacter sp.]